MDMEMVQLPIADMRGVKFNSASGVYLRKLGDLCERCGDYDNCEGSSKEVNELEVDIVVSECLLFSPIIMFVNPVGTEGEFSTLRLGKAWVKRVVKGSVVSLYDKKKGKYGEAMVDKVFCDTKENIIQRSIDTNHTMLDSEGTEIEKCEKLSKIVKRLYGNLIWINNEYATILGLRRVS